MPTMAVLHGEADIWGEGGGQISGHDREQNACWCIAAQSSSSAFNRGMLLNVGFTQASTLRDDHWDCFIFHDVDLLPLNDHNLYTCPAQPRHMSVAVDSMAYRSVRVNINVC